jgi:hypothetical protein
MNIRLLGVALIGLLATACGDTNYSIAAPAQVQAPLNRTSIEFRVNGNASSAKIRFSNPVDGLTQVVTSLPYVTELTTQQPVLFLSLDVTPVSYPFFVANPFMSAQIIINGILFREATSNDTLLNTLSVSGTYRAQ